MTQAAIILAAGLSSRFFPFSLPHKSLFVLMGRTILEHTIKSLSLCGEIESIAVVVSPHFPTELKNSLTLVYPQLVFVEQPKPIGNADAVLRAIKAVEADHYLLTNSQHVDVHTILAQLSPVSNEYIQVGRVPTQEPWKYGVVKVDDQDRVVEFCEKPNPEEAKGLDRLVGVYRIPKQLAHSLEPFESLEYGLEALLSQLTNQGKLKATLLSKSVASLKYAWDLFSVRDHLDFGQRPLIDPSAEISPHAILEGPIVVEAGARIHHFAVVTGPCYIGKNVVVGTHCVIREGSCLEEGVVVERSCDIKNSLIQSGTHIHSQYLGDSLLGRECRIGAGFISANVRLDRHPIEAEIKGSKISTYRTKYGLCAGDRVKIGVGVNTMPGTTLGEESMVGPGLSVKGTHQPHSQLVSSNV